MAAMLCLHPTCAIDHELSIKHCTGGLHTAKGEVQVVEEETHPRYDVGAGYYLPDSILKPFEPGAEGASPSMRVLCVGFVWVAMHYEYAFHIAHPCGCSWKAQRRYSALLALHEELTVSFDGLPAFPPKGSFTQRLTVQDRDVAAQRAAALQRYFHLLALRAGVLRHPQALAAFGAGKPEVVRSVRVVRWEQSARGQVVLELDVRANVRAEGCPRPVEEIVVEVRVLHRDGAASPSALGPTADGTLFAAPQGELLRIPVLPRDTEMELHVRAQNSLGLSPPVAIRVAVPAADTSSAWAGAISAAAPPFPEDALGGGLRRCRGGTRSLAGSLPVGGRVQAIWAGDGNWYDAVVRYVDDQWGWVTVDWLRPRPLDGDGPRCVCEVGGDDTTHRRVLPSQVRSVGTGEALRSGADSPGGYRESI